MSSRNCFFLHLRIALSNSFLDVVFPFSSKRGLFHISRFPSHFTFHTVACRIFHACYSREATFRKSFISPQNNSRFRVFPYSTASEYVKEHTHIHTHIVIRKLFPFLTSISLMPLRSCTRKRGCTRRKDRTASSLDLASSVLGIETNGLFLLGTWVKRYRIAASVACELSSFFQR